MRQALSSFLEKDTEDKACLVPTKTSFIKITVRFLDTFLIAFAHRGAFAVLRLLTDFLHQPLDSNLDWSKIISRFV